MCRAQVKKRPRCSIHRWRSRDTSKNIFVVKSGSEDGRRALHMDTSARHKKAEAAIGPGTPARATDLPCLPPGA